MKFSNAPRTSGFGKWTAAMLEFYSRFRFWPNLHYQRVILHRPTKFRQNRPTLGGVMTSYPFFKMVACSHMGFDLGNMLVSAWSSNLVLIRFIVSEILWFLFFSIWAWIAYSHPYLGVLDVTHRSNLQKAPSCAATHRLSAKVWKSVQGFDLGTGSRKK